MESVTKILHVNGEAVEIPRLTVLDLISLTESILADYEQIARKLAKEAKFDKFEEANMILDIRMKKPTLSQIDATANTPDGAVTIVRKSMGKLQMDRVKQDFLLGNINILDVIDLAHMLVQDVQEEKKVEEKKENPTPADPLISVG